MTEPILVLTAENQLAWKIATVSHGSEGECPRDRDLCPSFLETGVETSCVSGSGGSMCGGFLGGPPGFVYCSWGSSFPLNVQALTMLAREDLVTRGGVG